MKEPYKFPQSSSTVFLIFIRAVSGFMASSSVCLAGLLKQLGSALVFHQGSSLLFYSL